MRDQNVFLIHVAKTRSYVYVSHFQFSIYGDSSSCLLEMIMLIGSVGNATRIKIMVGKK